MGGDVAETGDGPGSFQVAGNVWHLEYGNPEVSRYLIRSKIFHYFQKGMCANVFHVDWFCYDERWLANL